MSLGNGDIERTLTAGHLPVRDVGFVDLNTVDADLACGALTRHVIATDTDNTLHEGLLATGRDEACELSDLADRGGRRDLRRSKPSERIVEDDDITTVNV